MKKLIKTLITFITIILLAVVIYVVYVFVQYYRLDDNLVLEIDNNQNEIIDLDMTYSVITYNIGFGAYTPEYSFFMDEGEMFDGTKTKGKYAKAFNKEVVIENTESFSELFTLQKSDFVFCQEVDIKAKRSYKVNQFAHLQERLSLYSNVFANNFHTAFLLYPFNDMMGSSKSGIATFSKYHIDEAKRYAFPLSESKMANLFDLDRCFLVTRHQIANGKELVLINVHMSAFDEGGLVRKEQMRLLNDFLENEKDNYVIVGGDFNHKLADPSEAFITEQKLPEWVALFDFAALNSNYQVIAATNAATCRSTDMEYIAGINYMVIVDGFIVNKNIKVEAVEVIDLDFTNSDHNPVKLTFKLLSEVL